MSRVETKKIILQNAMEIIQDHGIKNLTLEKVAKKSKISKGGLLYHFPTKESIINEIIANMLSKFEAKLRNSMEVNQSQDWSLNYLKSTFEDLHENQFQSSGLILALAEQITQMELLRKKYKEWDKQMSTNKSKSVNSIILRYAAEGIWFCETFGLSKLSQKEKKKLLEQAEKLGNEN
jgi:AcrR family transcriptional regulator